MTMPVLFLESIKPDTNRILYNEEMKENTSHVNVLCCSMKTNRLFVSFTNEFFLLPITNGLSKQLIVFIINSHGKYLLDLYESGKMPDKWNFRAGCIEENQLGYM